MSSYDNKLRTLGIDPTVFKGNEYKLINILNAYSESPILCDAYTKTTISAIVRVLNYRPMNNDEWKLIKDDLKNCSSINYVSIEYAIKEYCTKENK